MLSTNVGVKIWISRCKNMSVNFPHSNRQLGFVTSSRAGHAEMKVYQNIASRRWWSRWSMTGLIVHYKMWSHLWSHLSTSSFYQNLTFSSKKQRRGVSVSHGSPLPPLPQDRIFAGTTGESSAEPGSDWHTSLCWRCCCDPQWGQAPRILEVGEDKRYPSWEGWAGPRSYCQNLHWRETLQVATPPHPTPLPSRSWLSPTDSQWAGSSTLWWTTSGTRRATIDHIGATREDRRATALEEIQESGCAWSPWLNCCTDYGLRTNLAWQLMWLLCIPPFCSDHSIVLNSLCMFWQARLANVGEGVGVSVILLLFILCIMMIVMICACVKEMFGGKKVTNFYRGARVSLWDSRGYKDRP